MRSGEEMNDSDSDAWGAWKTPEAPRESCRRARKQDPARKVCGQELRRRKTEQHPDRQGAISYLDGYYRRIKKQHDDPDDEIHLPLDEVYYSSVTDSEDEEYYGFTRYTRARPSIKYVLLRRPATIVKNLSPTLESREFMYIAHVWCVI